MSKVEYGGYRQEEIRQLQKRLKETGDTLYNFIEKSEDVGEYPMNNLGQERNDLIVKNILLYNEKLEKYCGISKIRNNINVIDFDRFGPKHNESGGWGRMVVFRYDISNNDYEVLINSNIMIVYKTKQTRNGEQRFYHVVRKNFEEQTIPNGLHDKFALVFDWPFFTDGMKNLKVVDPYQLKNIK